MDGTGMNLTAGKHRDDISVGSFVPRVSLHAWNRRLFLDLRRSQKETLWKSLLDKAAPCWVVLPVMYVDVLTADHSVTRGHRRRWRTAKASEFEMPNLCLQRVGRWSLQQLLIIQSVESGGRPQLSTSVCCWRRSPREEREAWRRVCLNSRSSFKAAVDFMHNLHNKSFGKVVMVEEHKLSTHQWWPSNRWREV